jgi:hypothetical protein
MFNNKRYLLIVLFILLTLGFSGCYPQVYVDKPAFLHDVGKSNLQLLWMRENVYSAQDDFHSQISAANGLLCILGDIEYPPEKAMSCVDGVSNDLKWQKSLGNATDILLAPDGVYVSYVGYSPGIEKYDYEGGLIWSQTFTGTGIIYFYNYKNDIQAFLHPERFLVLNSETGDTIENIKDVDIILKDSENVFTKNSYLESQDINSKDINWSLEIGNSVRLKPLFTEEFIFLRTGRTLGSVLAVKRQTGDVILHTEKNVISNVVYLPQNNQIVVLNENGLVVSIDIISGEQTQLVEFTNPPFFLNGEENVGGYELAFDESQNILFVLLGDSRQLYAFQMK